MAKKANTAKGAAEKARRNTKQPEAITESPKAPTVEPTTPEPRGSASPPPSAVEVGAKVARAHGALKSFLKRVEFTTTPSNIGSRIVGLPPSETLLSDAANELLKAIRSAEDLQPDADQLAKLAFTHVRDALRAHRLNLVYPEMAGGNGAEFAQGQQLTRQSLDSLASAAMALEAWEHRDGNTAEATPEHDDEEWQPADYFPVKMHDRLRHAAGKDRKNKRVRKKVVDGTTLYSLSDARRWWGKELNESA
ncbi:MAG: hypothetical protein NTU45_14485 [Planctomycetota bacterium]|nr:hypothetical protein [Planctomycetota bacterium]